MAFSYRTGLKLITLWPSLNHHRQHVGKLVALRLGQALKLPEAEMLRLLLTAGVIPLAGKAEVVVGGIAAV